MAGVVFTIQRVEADLSTNAGFAAAAALTPATATPVWQVFTVTTGPDGKITQDNLPVGVYLVTETDYSNATVNGQSASTTRRRPRHPHHLHAVWRQFPPSLGARPSGSV